MKMKRLKELAGLQSLNEDDEDDGEHEMHDIQNAFENIGDELSGMYFDMLPAIIKQAQKQGDTKSAVKGELIRKKIAEVRALIY